MPSKLPQYPLRTDKGTLDKLKTIAKKHNRTLNKEIEYILLKYIEQEEGIELSERENDKIYFN